MEYFFLSIRAHWCFCPNIHVYAINVEMTTDSHMFFLMF